MERGYEVTAGYGLAGGIGVADAPKVASGVQRAMGTLDANIELFAKFLSDLENRLTAAGVLRAEPPTNTAQSAQLNRIESSQSGLADAITSASARVRHNGDRLASLLNRLDL
jgi:hypothetical protein